MAGSAFPIMPTVDAIPMRHEVERQLDRMLAHPLFRAKEKQAKILAFLVRNALDGKQVEEGHIFAELFLSTGQRYAPDTTVVRTTISHIRGRLLDKYYAGDGQDDPVIIALPAAERTLQSNGKYSIVKLPPGTAYRPQFRYNPRSEIARDFALANHLAMGGPSEIEQSLWRYDAILKREPDHPDAVLGFVEALGSQLLFGIYTDESVRAAFIAAGLEMIARLDPTTADYWRTHMVRGLLHTCANDFDAARKEFDIALTLDRQSTVSRGWYVQFLFMAGEQEEALSLLELKAAERVDDPKSLAIYGIHLCRASRFEEAERALRHALGLDRNYWPAHWGIVLLCLSTGRPQTAQAHAQLLESLLEREDYEFLMRQVNLRPDELKSN
jgi:tetratricopeptide (TPR) repeat protein